MLCHFRGCWVLISVGALLGLRFLRDWPDGWSLRCCAVRYRPVLELSSHLFPEVSAHLLAATPTCHWLEWVDWAEPLLDEPLRIVDGHAVVSERPGNGLVWNAKAVEKYRM